jgi:hypothetical protein
MAIGARAFAHVQRQVRAHGHNVDRCAPRSSAGCSQRLDSSRCMSMDDEYYVVTKLAGKVHTLSRCAYIKNRQFSMVGAWRQ